MPVSDKQSQIRTMKCDAPGCDKEVTFDVLNQEDIAKLPEWLKTGRNVQLGNRAGYFYCGDVCEVKGVTTGQHNIPEPTKVQGATPAQADEVIRAARATKEALQPEGSVTLD